MHPRVMDERNAAAQKRLLGAARRLAEGSSLEDKLAALIHASAGGRDPAVAALVQREAIADLLEALVNSVPESVAQPGKPATGGEPESVSAPSVNPFTEPVPGVPAEDEVPAESVPESVERQARRGRVRRAGKG